MESPPIRMLISPGSTLRDTPRESSAEYLGTCDPGKLTVNMNHHNGSLGKAALI